MKTFKDSTRNRNLLKKGTVLHVVQTDQHGDIRYHIFGHPKPEGWIKKRSRPMISLYATIPDERGRDNALLGGRGGVLVYAQCPNCLNWNAEAFSTCTRCGIGLVGSEPPVTDPNLEAERIESEEIEKEAEDVQHGRARGPPPGLNPATIAEDVAQMQEKHEARKMRRMLYLQTSPSLINFGSDVDVNASMRELALGFIKKGCERFLQQYQSGILGPDASDQWGALIERARSMRPRESEWE